MESIFHEKQEGSLCAQHCLNALLQNQYFSAVDLAQIGERLDEREKERMAEGGIDTHEYQQFIKQPSNNFDDSGFFSIQVISEALSVWSLDMVVYTSSSAMALQAREDPTQMTSFICNYLQHWFCVRRLGTQWFNLNSLLSGPELVSNTYLSLFLTQLQQEGYSIFIITGDLPGCEAEQLLRLMPAVQTVKPHLLAQDKDSTSGADQEDEDIDGALKEALRASKAEVEGGDSALQHALKMSMEGFYADPSYSSFSVPEETSLPKRPSQGTSQGLSVSGSSAPIAASSPATQEELREKRLAFLQKQTKNQEPAQNSNENQTKEDARMPQSMNQSKDSTVPDEEDGQSSNEEQGLSEEELLKRAIDMSMEQS